MSQFIRTVAATLAVGLLLAVPAAMARPIDGPGTPTPVPTAEPPAGLPTWPVNPDPLVQPQPAPAPAADDGGGVSPMAYIIPAGAIALMLGAALVYVAGPRRARAGV
jgi:hypothetical protein